jgi:hypothetical protein
MLNKPCLIFLLSCLQELNNDEAIVYQPDSAFNLHPFPLWARFIGGMGGGNLPPIPLLVYKLQTSPLPLLIGSF